MGAACGEGERSRGEGRLRYKKKHDEQGLANGVGLTIVYTDGLIRQCVMSSQGRPFTKGARRAGGCSDHPNHMQPSTTTAPPNGASQRLAMSGGSSVVVTVPVPMSPSHPLRPLYVPAAA